MLLGFRPFEMEYKGHRITMEVRPLKTSEIGIVLPSAQAAEQGKDNRSTWLKETFNIQAASAPLFRDAVRNISGLDALVGGPVTPEMLSEETVLLPVVMRVVQELIRISSLTEDDVKN